jgi:hypothetical protein
MHGNQHQTHIGQRRVDEDVAAEGIPGPDAGRVVTPTGTVETPRLAVGGQRTAHPVLMLGVHFGPLRGLAPVGERRPWGTDRYGVELPGHVHAGALACRVFRERGRRLPFGSAAK